jgi:hypothetical protein
VLGRRRPPVVLRVGRPPIRSVASSLAEANLYTAHLANQSGTAREGENVPACPPRMLGFRTGSLTVNDSAQAHVNFFWGGYFRRHLRMPSAKGQANPQRQVFRDCLKGPGTARHDGGRSEAPPPQADHRQGPSVAQPARLAFCLGMHRAGAERRLEPKHSVLHQRESYLEKIGGRPLCKTTLGRPERSASARKRFLSSVTDRSVVPGRMYDTQIAHWGWTRDWADTAALYHRRKTR